MENGNSQDERRNRDDRDINFLILRIISQYNRNNEDYNQNMASLIHIMQTITSSRPPPPPVNEFFTFDFTNSASTLVDTLLPLFSTNRTTSLSQADISNGTVVYAYHKEEGAADLTCPITLETIHEGESVMKINRCNHVFKEQSLRRWFERNQRCPVCRGGL
jgi:hypothetical protein